jgi:putative addiction module component (TIGR02574 family)
VLTDDDKRWIQGQLEKVETTLLTEFHKWASPVELRQKSHAAALRALDVEVESLSDRLKNLEGRWNRGAVMAQMSPQASEWLEKALKLSEQERKLLIDGLVESLANERAAEDVGAARSAEVRRRVDDIRSGRVKTIPGEQVLRELAEEFPDVISTVPAQGRPEK